MSSSSSSSDTDNESDQTDDSDWNYIPGIYVINEPTTEVEGTVREATAIGDSEPTGPEVGPCANEPAADEEWQTQYREKKQSYDGRLKELQSRLDGTEEVSKWCKCGNCTVQLVHNAKECQCCMEIEECVESLNSEIVLQEVERPPTCIINHPGFDTLCLDKWSLRLTATKLRTRKKQEYRQTSTEDRFFRSVAYRSFVWLVYGHLGNRRYPLPTCAYNQIRKRFLPDVKDDLVGFVEEDSS